MSNSTSSRLLMLWVPLAGFVIWAGYLIGTEHRLHLFQFLPFLFLAACPLMYIFMHKHHSGYKVKIDKDCTTLYIHVRAWEKDHENDTTRAPLGCFQKHTGDSEFKNQTQ
ncbi:MAG: DUF2933 domain-containing protein [Gammaproteobacteria bacterium]|nr:DUF2933 domain-containing protein [Gammaproteobacteria bacterium]